MAPKGRPKKVLKTLRGDLLAHARARLASVHSVVFPCPRYQADPAAFCREILGIEPFPWQVEIMEAVRDHKRVAVRSGHKIGKSRTAAMLALWFYCSFEDARVVLTSTTDRQVNAILWREIRKVHAGSGVCLECKASKYKGPKPCPHSALIEGSLGELARTGLKAKDFREITGYTAKEPEAIAGVSGGNLLYLPDEASGIPDEIFQAIEGNRAGGARVAMFSNPTRNLGVFYDAFHTKADLWKGFTISSEFVARYLAERGLRVPGMAELEWVEEMRKDWGPDSAAFAVRILGRHATKEEGRIFGLHAIGQAEEFWKDGSDDDADGHLQLGIDPAGPSGSGDESAFSLRRGLRELDKFEARGLTEEGHLVQVLKMLSDHRRDGEAPLVVVDREGKVGSQVYGLLAAHADNHPGDYRLVGVRASDRAVREPRVYDRMRDCLCASVEGWIKDGGAFMPDIKRAQEMHVLEWYVAAQNGRYKLIPKDKIKGLLGRSPDRYDALALALWEPSWLREGAQAGVAAGAAVPSAAVVDGRIDPYDGASSFRY